MHQDQLHVRNFSGNVGQKMRIYLENKKWITDNSTLEFIEQYGKWMMYGLAFAGTIELVGFSALSVTLIRTKYQELVEEE